ncbi:hypothetical protein [Microcoleus sp. D2_18a_D3]
MVSSNSTEEGGRQGVIVSGRRSDSRLWAIEHPTVGDRPHLAKK